jgi:hypothetical protein
MRANVDKTEIMGQIADMSRLLGMLPEDGTVSVTNPITSEGLTLSEWFAETRDSFLRLSLLVGRALDLPFQ